MIISMLLTVQLLLYCLAVNAISDEYRQQLQHEAGSMFEHAYNGYMTHAFPLDELKPLSGIGIANLIQIGISNNEHIQYIDSYNGVALSMIDSLTTLAVLNHTQQFTDAVNWLLSTDNTHMFDIDIRVSVFETNIRILGGLISAHILASDPSLHLYNGSYSSTGTLLPLATDLGNRLLHAFNNTSVLPYAYVNLHTGLSDNETRINCAAGIGTLLIELGTLGVYNGETLKYVVKQSSN